MTPPFSRLCYAATRVVMRDEYLTVNHSPERPGAPDELARYIDWDATMARRVWLDGLGFGIAEAMDTAQRFSLGWQNAEELIARCGALALRIPFIAGAGTDHLTTIHSEGELIEAVAYQARFIQRAGGWVIILPMPHLAAIRADEETYLRVYAAIIDQLEGPLFIHWLGEMFMPSLHGYFPGDSFFRVMAHDPAKVRGAKLSLLDADFECRARQRLAQDEQIVLTGDDLHFADLIRGDNTPTRETTIGNTRVPLGDFSHALLGVFDAIAVPASAALQRLAQGDTAAYAELMAPCEVLGQWIFQAPTHYYRSGLAFLAWINGQQSNPMLINHEQRRRDHDYYATCLHLARAADILTNPALANQRIQELPRYLSLR